MDNEKTLLDLDAFRDMYTPAIHISKLTRKTQESQFLKHSVSEFLVRDNVLVIS